MDSNLQKVISGLDDAGLSELETSVREAREAKRDKLDLNDIKPGMSGDELARVRSEINRVLAGR